jgi:hypothetical protein
MKWQQNCVHVVFHWRLFSLIPNEHCNDKIRQDTSMRWLMDEMMMAKSPMLKYGLSFSFDCVILMMVLRFCLKPNF